MKKVLKVSCKYSQKGSQKMVEKVIRIGLQSKYSGPSPAFVDCQKDSQTTVGNGTQVKPVLLAVKIFAVHSLPDNSLNKLLIFILCCVVL